MKFRPLLILGLSVSCLTPSTRLFAESSPAAPEILSAPSSVPVQHWNWAVPQPHGNSLWDVKFTHNRFLAVGSQGTIQTSPNGIAWTQRTSGTRSHLASIAEGPNALAVLGLDGTVVVSTDGGDTWDTRSISLPDPTGTASITYGNGAYVAVGGYPSHVYASTDLQNWTLVVSGSDIPSLGDVALRGVTFNNGQFLIASFNGTILRSTNGFQWTASTTPMVKGFSVAYGNGHYVATTLYGSYTSNDGVTWTQQWNGKINGQYVSSFDVRYVGGQFVSVGGSMITSPDGISWTLQRSITGIVDFKSFAYGANTYVAVGSNGFICTSPNLVSWQPRTARPTSNYSDIAAGPTGFVAVSVGTSKYSFSSDGRTWTDIDPGAKSPTKRVVYSNDRYLAVSMTKLGMSTDGKKWTQYPFPSGPGIPSFNSIAWGHDRYVAVAGFPALLSASAGLPAQSPPPNPGKVYWSNDGSTWNPALVPAVGNILDILFDGTKFVAVGDNNTVLTSVDGSSWTIQSTGGKGILNRIAFDGTTYVTASSTPDRVYASVDLQNWTQVTLPAEANGNGDFRDVIYATGRFAILTGHGTLYYSADGLNWDISDCDTDGQTEGIACDGNRYVVVKNSGCILYSDTLH